MVDRRPSLTRFGICNWEVRAPRPRDEVLSQTVAGCTRNLECHSTYFRTLVSRSGNYLPLRNSRDRNAKIKHSKAGMDAVELFPVRRRSPRRISPHWDRQKNCSKRRKLSDTAPASGPAHHRDHRQQGTQNSICQPHSLPPLPSVLSRGFGLRLPADCPATRSIPALECFILAFLSREFLNGR